MKTLLLCFCLTLPSVAQQSIWVHAIAHASQRNVSQTPTGFVQYLGSGISAMGQGMSPPPGTTTSVGNCTGNAMQMNCSITTQTSPPATPPHYVTISVANDVEVNGMRYTISCLATWSGSNCATLVDGDWYVATIQNQYMWVSLLGNKGKPVTTKYRITNIRQSSSGPSTRHGAEVQSTGTGQASKLTKLPSNNEKSDAESDRFVLLSIVRAGPQTEASKLLFKQILAMPDDTVRAVYEQFEAITQKPLQHSASTISPKKPDVDDPDIPTLRRK